MKLADASNAEVRNAYAVASPRESDAVGNALRCVYDRDPGLPDDMAALLRRLDARGNDHGAR